MRRLGLPREWVSARRINDDGYVVNTLESGSEKLEHRMVAERILGRPLVIGEVVHHINGRRKDNRPQNLCVMSAGDHDRYHEWYDWIFKAYGKYPRRETQLKKLKEDFNGTLIGEFAQASIGHEYTKKVVQSRSSAGPSYFRLFFGALLLLGLMFTIYLVESGPSLLPTKFGPAEATHQKKQLPAERTKNVFNAQEFNSCTAICYEKNQGENQKNRCIEKCQKMLPD